jgi:hypothetical protein
LTGRAVAVDPGAHGKRGGTLVVFAGIAALYVLLLFAPDQSLHWAASDEACCHIPTIKAIQEEGLRTALTDSSHYRSATMPLYHLVMSFMLGRVDRFAIKCAWIVITLISSVLVYLHLSRDQTLQRKRSAAVALTLAFMLSPTVRASALYFVTDGLAVHFAVAALVLLQSARAARPFSLAFGLAALVAAFASFYTRQYYLWAALFVAYVSFTEGDRRVTMASAVACVLLVVPALMIFSIWRGLTPPLDTPLHTTPAFRSTFPNATGLLALYALPLAWVAVRDIGRAHSGPTPVERVGVVAVLCGAAVYAAVWLTLGFEIPEAGGILRTLRRLGAAGDVAFLMISYAGIVMLARWLIVDGPSQLWWGVFLLPLLTGSLLLQRYVEPAILVFMFFVARPRDALQVLDSPLVWFYPLFTAIYSVTRAMYFTSA